MTIHSEYIPPRVSSTSITAKKNTLSPVGMGVIAAAIICAGGYMFAHSTTGKEMGLKHGINSVLNPDAARLAGDKVAFSQLDPAFIITANETCLHGRPKKSALVEVCFGRGTEIHGQIFTPADPKAKAEWVVASVSPEGSGDRWWTGYLPLKDLKAVPPETTAPKAPATAAHAKKPKPAHKL